MFVELSMRQSSLSSSKGPSETLNSKINFGLEPLLLLLPELVTQVPVNVFAPFDATTVPASLNVKTYPLKSLVSLLPSSTKLLTRQVPDFIEVSS